MIDLARIGIGISAGVSRSEIEIAGPAQQGLHFGDFGSGAVAPRRELCTLELERFLQTSALLPRLLERGKARGGIVYHQGSGSDAPFASGAGTKPRLA